MAPFKGTPRHFKIQFFLGHLTDSRIYIMINPSSVSDQSPSGLFRRLLGAPPQYCRAATAFLYSSMRPVFTVSSVSSGFSMLTLPRPLVCGRGRRAREEASLVTLTRGSGKALSKIRREARWCASSQPIVRQKFTRFRVNDGFADANRLGGWVVLRRSGATRGMIPDTPRGSQARFRDARCGHSKGVALDLNGDGTDDIALFIPYLGCGLAAHGNSAHFLVWRPKRAHEPARSMQMNLRYNAEIA